MPFRKAEKTGFKIRLAICGPTGSGKTKTALKIAKAIGGPIGVIDAERESSLRYADEFDFDIDSFEADSDFSPLTFTRKIQEGGKLFNVLIVDGISPAWAGRGGALELVDKAVIKGKGNKFTAWRDVTPQHNALVDAMLQCECHLIVTMRMKMDYVIEDGEKGRKNVKKVGLAIIQRDGIEYEFDVVGEMDQEHHIFFTKTRCSELDGKVFHLPGEEVAAILLDWAGVVPGDKPIDAKPKPSRNASSTSTTQEPPPSSSQPADDQELTVQFLLNRLPAGLAQIGVPANDIPEAVEAASLLMREKWEVDEVDDIPDTEAANLRLFMRGEMKERLKSFVPEAA